MKMMKVTWSVCLLASAIGQATVAPECRAQSTYHLLRQIPVSWEGQCQSLTVDSVSHHLYLAQDATIEVVDVNKGGMVGSLTNAVNIRSFAVAPMWRRGFLCDGQNSKVDIIDLFKCKLAQSIKTEKNPGRILFDQGRSALYTLNEADHSISIFEADDGDFVATVPLPGMPAVAAADQKNGKVYCSLEGKGTLVVMDPRTHKITDQWNIVPDGGVSAMLVDALRHRLFLGCRNQTVLMVDTVKGAVLSGISVKGQVDGLALDATSGHLFISAGEELTVAGEYAATDFRVADTLEMKTKPQAVGFDPVARRLYVAAASADVTSDPAPASAGQNAKSPQTSILVYAQ
jgi:DNA-binding beta-propeller fold protein YncE